MLDERLIQRAAETGTPLSEAQANRLARFHEMLTDANKTMNLTRVSDDPDEAIDRNYLDSLAPLRFPALLSQVETLCDAGSGAGFPGIPLAIACPTLRITLIDSLGKRVKFLQSVIDALQLNAEAIHARLEDAARDRALRDRFDVVTARAVAPLPTLLELAMPFARVGGLLLAYKGPALSEELPASHAALNALSGRVRDVLACPVRDFEHRLLVVEKTAPTRGAYPRKAGLPAKEPL